MLTTRQKEKREKIGERLKKLKYRLFQAEVAFASHDEGRLKEMARRIGINSKRIIGLLTEKIKRSRTVKKRKRAIIRISK
jgi:hypothetical protein